MAYGRDQIIISDAFQRYLSTLSSNAIFQRYLSTLSRFTLTQILFNRPWCASLGLAAVPQRHHANAYVFFIQSALIYIKSVLILKKHTLSLYYFCLPVHNGRPFIQWSSFYLYTMVVLLYNGRPFTYTQWSSFYTMVVLLSSFFSVNKIRFEQKHCKNKKPEPVHFSPTPIFFRKKRHFAGTNDRNHENQISALFLQQYAYILFYTHVHYSTYICTGLYTQYAHFLRLHLPFKHKSVLTHACRRLKPTLDHV